MENVTISEQQFKRAVAAFRNHEASHQAKKDRVTELFKRSDDLELKLDKLTEQLRGARVALQVAKDDYPTTGNVAPVVEAKQAIAHLETEIDLLKQLEPAVNSAAASSGADLTRFEPRPPYAEAAQLVADRIGPDLYFFLWLWQRAYGRILPENGRFRSNVLGRITHESNEAEFKEMMVAAGM